MSRLTKRQVFSWIGIIAVLAAAPYVYREARTFLREDPLADLRADRSQLENEEAIVAENLHMTHYDGERLVHEATADKVTISSDRNAVRAYGIKDGKLYEKGKISVKYEAKDLEWNDASKFLKLNGPIRAFNKDLDLKTQLLTYSEQTGRMESTKPIQGKFWDGQISAANLAYNLKSKKFVMGAVSWQGTGKAPEDDKPPRKWSIKGSGVTGEFGVSEIYSKGEATDGEIIVKADKVVRDVKTDVLTATGNVRYFSKEVNLMCERVTVHRKERRAILEGRVSMLIKPEDQQTLQVVELQPMRPIVPEEIAANRPKPSQEDRTQVRDPENRRKYPVMVTATRIEYVYRKGARRAVITGAPQARQDLGPGKWRHLWANSADWNGETNQLQLMSAAASKSVRLRTSLDDDLLFKTFTLSTKEGDSKWSGTEPEGFVYPDDDEESAPPTTPPTPGGSGGISGKIGA